MSQDQQPQSIPQPTLPVFARPALFGSLKTRLGWSYALASVIPLGLLGNLLITTNMLARRRNIAASQQTLADWVAREIGSYVSGVDNQLLKLGERADLRQSPTALGEAILAQRESMPDIVDLSLVDGQGRERARVAGSRMFQ